MRSLGLLLTAVTLSHYASCYQGGHRDIYHDTTGRTPQKRNIVYDGQIADSYDFVIVGGGTAGLAIAARLTEDANTTVLVLEAGDTGDAVKENIDVPGNAYYMSLLGSSYDWAFKTVPQPGANNRAIGWPRGKVIGGSSAINGMYLIRPSQTELDMMASMIPNGDNWKWDNFFAAMKKGENFTAPSSDIQSEANIEYVMQSHGTTGPLQVSYPGFIVPVVGSWTQTLANAGIPMSQDPSGGQGWGGFIASSTINPTNWTRSHSRAAYIDPLPPRPNLAILPNAAVTRVIFDSANNLTATSVEYAASRDAPRLTVNVTKEVILAAGTVGSPHVLLHSGVGPEDVLTAAGVPVIHNLPGVGQHLQDHISTEVVWTTNDDTAASLYQSELPTLPTAGGQSNPFLSFVNSATCYANISTIFNGDDWQTFIADTTGALETSSSTLVPSQDATVIAGYKAIYNATASLLNSPIGQLEILLSLTAAPQAGNHGIAVQAALQHPFSQGRLWINSPDPFDYPLIDPQYLSHPADKVMFREGLKFARKLGNTPPLSSAMIEEVYPGSSVQTDDDWDQWISQTYGTEFHPIGSLAMLPLDLGGVVDTNLKVYGLSNVRVVDASVFQFSFSAHMMAPVYGLAEQAASLIRSQYNDISLSQVNNTNSSTSGNDSGKPPSQSEQGPGHGNQNTVSGASWTVPHIGLTLSALLAGVVAILQL